MEGEWTGEVGGEGGGNEEVAETASASFTSVTGRLRRCGPLSQMLFLRRRRLLMHLHAKYCFSSVSKTSITLLKAPSPISRTTKYWFIIPSTLSNAISLQISMALSVIASANFSSMFLVSFTVRLARLDDDEF